MISLRPYQSDIIESVRSAYAQGRRAPLVVLPTGGGKTTIFAYVTTQTASRQKCVFLLCHRAELVKQISMTLAKFSCRHRIVAPPAIINQCKAEQYKALGLHVIDPSARVYVASVQTLIKQLDHIADKPDLIVIDEAHHLTATSTWGRIIEHYPKARLLPVTATPCRLDGKGLGVDHGGLADDIILGKTMSSLINDGFLSPYRAFCPPTALDLSGIKKTAGDYNKGQLADAMDRPTITGDAVKHYTKLAQGKRAIVFCVSVAHAEHVAATFAQSGIPAASLDGSMTPAERDNTIKAFESGKTLVLTSCDVVSEGFDLPAIEVAILLRPTHSLSLYLQQVGRALRTFKGKKEAIILDHVGAIARHGLPDTEHEWTLEGKRKRGRKTDDDGEAAVNIVTCKECYSVFAKKEPTCPYCGWHQPAPQGRQIEETEGELVEIDLAQLKAQRKKEQSQAKTYDELLELAIKRGYNYPKQWVSHILKSRGDHGYRR